MPTAEDLIREYDYLVNRRRPWEPQWRELVEFIRPNSRRVQDLQFPGARQTTRLYDTTAPDANRKLANFINGSLTSSSTRWFNLITRDESLMREREVAMWLDETATRIYAAFQQSNFNAVVPQVYASLSAMGLAAMYLEAREQDVPGFNGFRFTVIPVGQFVVDDNHEGFVDTFARMFELTAKAAVGKFGLEKLPERIQKAYKDPRCCYDRFQFIHFVMPRANGDGRSSKKLPVASYYLEYQSKTIVKESGYHEMPVFVPRWETEEGEVYGRGPGHIALPDIRSLNASKKIGLEALTLQVRPPLQVPHDGINGGIARLTPAAQNSMMDDREIKPILLGQDLKSEMVKGDELRQQIRSVFHRDLVALPDKNYMTATEIVKQLDLIHRELGPTIGNIEDQLLRPLIDRAFGLMWRAKAIAPPPPALDGADLDITYEGPLARAQRSGDLTAYQGALALVAGMAEFDQTVLDNLDTDEQVRYIWQTSGVPDRLLRSNSARDKIRTSRAQAAQMQTNITQAQGMADAAVSGATAVKTAKEAMQPQGTA